MSERFVWTCPECGEDSEPGECLGSVSAIHAPTETVRVELVPKADVTNMYDEFIAERGMLRNALVEHGETDEQLAARYATLKSRATRCVVSGERCHSPSFCRTDGCQQ